MPAELRRLGDAIGAPDDPAGAVARTWRNGSGCRRNLADCGVTDDDLDAVSRLSQANRNVQLNVRPVSEDDARSILAAAY